VYDNTGSAGLFASSTLAQSYLVDNTSYVTFNTSVKSTLHDVKLLFNPNISISHPFETLYLNTPLASAVFQFLYKQVIPVS
jgi:hypothetical protein